MRKQRILFIVKKQRFGYSGGGPSSGLYNSARFVSEMLKTELHQISKLVVVDDNNDIDREVTEFRPNIVVIEALWVIPRKFEQLKRLHPEVKWVVRNHSAIPFLAHEGNAMSWLFQYDDIEGVAVGCNDHRTLKELEGLFVSDGSTSQVWYLPNYYPPKLHERNPNKDERALDIGCFGALRSLKNQLIQAVAAILYADSTSKFLRFHVNTTRLEGDGEAIKKNLHALFANTPHELHEHGWLERDRFIHLIRKMDLGMQVSFSETFNVVTADFVMNDIPVVVSPEISWVYRRFQADPTSSHDIVSKIKTALHFPNMRRQNVVGLRSYDEMSIEAWRLFLIAI